MNTIGCASYDSSYLCLSYPIIRYSDMEETMKKEVMDICTNACEKHTADNELVTWNINYISILIISNFYNETIDKRNMRPLIWSGFSVPRW